MPMRFIFSRGFLKDVRQLRKRFRLIEDDIDFLQAEMRQQGYRGVLLSGYEASIFKVRLANRSARRGKSGGFRAIYRLVDEDTILFIHVYSKTDQDDASADVILERIRDFN